MLTLSDNEIDCETDAKPYLLEIIIKNNFNCRQLQCKYLNTEEKDHSMESLCKQLKIIMEILTMTFHDIT